MRISDWSSDVCSSDLRTAAGRRLPGPMERGRPRPRRRPDGAAQHRELRRRAQASCRPVRGTAATARRAIRGVRARAGDRKGVVEGKSVSVRVDLGGRRNIKKKKSKKEKERGKE